MDRTDRAAPVGRAAAIDQKAPRVRASHNMGFLLPRPTGAGGRLGLDGGRRPPGSPRARMAETGNPAARVGPGLCRPAGPSRPPAGPPSREQGRRYTGFLSRGGHPGAVRTSGRFPEVNHRARSAIAAASFRWGVGRPQISPGSAKTTYGEPRERGPDFPKVFSAGGGGRPLVFRCRPADR